jgi:hypothetical protein
VESHRIHIPRHVFARLHFALIDLVDPENTSQRGACLNACRMVLNDTDPCSLGHRLRPTGLSPTQVVGQPVDPTVVAAEQCLVRHPSFEPRQILEPLEWQTLEVRHDHDHAFQQLRYLTAWIRPLDWPCPRVFCSTQRPRRQWAPKSITTTNIRDSSTPCSLHCECP